MDGWQSLNNDILSIVLSRLPTKYLPGLKCVCKAWHWLISDRAFIKLQLRRRETVSGFFIQQRYQWYESDMKTISYISVEKEGPELQQSVFGFLPEDVVLMASCNGLVCCRSCFPLRVACLYICNPLNNEWIRLSWDEADKETSFSLVFDPCRDPVDPLTHFRLVKVQQFETDMEMSYFSFEIYNSDTGAWKKLKEVCHCNYNLYKNKGIYLGGVSYWLTDGDEVLTLDLEHELSWLMSAPLPAAQFNSIPEACIGESDGRLHYVIVSEYGLHVWLLEDYFESRWSLKHSKTLEEMEKEHSKFFCNLHERVTRRAIHDTEPWIDPLVFKDGYLLMRVCANIMLYDIEVNKMREVCDVSALGSSSMFCPIVVPYSLSLAPLSWA